MFGKVKVYTGATRPIYEIAKEIAADWKKPYFSAVPYLEAMHQLDSIHDKYGYDDASEIIINFVANAGTWRGETARRIKDELKGMWKRRIAHAYGLDGFSNDSSFLRASR